MRQINYQIISILIVVHILFVSTIANASSNYNGLRLPCIHGENCEILRGGAAHGSDRHAVDFNLVNEDFVAIRGGKISFAGWKGNGLGDQIWVDNLDNHCTIYGHLSKIDVTQGQYIAQGQKIGKSGDTGNSNGPHLHVTVTRKSSGNCTAAQGNEVAMIFDELPSRELKGGDNLISQNSLTFFADIHGSYWAGAWIKKLYDLDITKGCSSSANLPIYCPESPVTRAQMAVFLLRTKYGGNYQPPAPTGIFVDVPVSYWAAGWIEQLYREEITKGCSSTANPPIYCPEDSVTRAQMAVFLLRTKYGGNYHPPAPTGIFVDVPVSYWAAGWIEQLYREEITKGCSSTANPPIYCPEDSVTRAQMAVFLLRTKYGGNYQP
jgi:hypothetical protein